LISGAALQTGPCSEIILEDMDDNGGAATPSRDHPLSASVLVLNRNYTAVRVVSARRAFSLLYRNCAEVIDAHDEEWDVLDFEAWVDRSKTRKSAPGLQDQFVWTPRFPILIPRVIRLVEYDKVPRREVKFSRRNILARDENRCQYCNKKLPTSQLSLDHVTPKSRGGKSTWTNVVTACTPCNTRKGGRMPWEASMKLRRVPAVPKKNPLLADKVKSPSYRMWRLFLGDGEMAIDA
jgi:5-methylcytosine-specific restriction endonuclease McrA